ncbi:MAG: hypothetical protein KGS72_07595 [Cyanobacteria bacterium REEB67]|nr:hypothetical protein [Cyanobacteria bacterium REEB67]
MDQVSTHVSNDNAVDLGDRHKPATDLDAHALLADKTSYQPDGQSANTASSYLPGLDLGDFKQAAQKLLAPVPKDEGGTYNGLDLVKMVGNPDLKGQDALVAATIYRMYQTTEGCAMSSSGGGGGGGGGASGGGSSSDQGAGAESGGGGRSHHPSDHKRVAQANPAPAAASEITCSHSFNVRDIDGLRPPLKDDTKVLDEFAKLTELDLFNRVDLNHDGKLSRSELAQSVRFAPIASEVPALGQALADAPAGLAYLDVRHIYADERRADSDYNRMKFSLEQAGKGLKEASSRELFADRANPLASIKMDDVVQGSVGNCYFESVLASVAGNKPEIIRDSIKDNQDGTFTVTFKGDAAHPVTVAAPTDTELAIYSQGSKDGIWAPVMEKAFSRYSVDVLKRPQFDGTAQDATAAGMEMPTMKLLTGENALAYHTTSCYENANLKIPSGDPVEINDLVAKSAIDGLTGGKLVTVGTSDGLARELGLDAHHAYTVISYTPGADGGTFVLRDPRGAIENRQAYPKITGAQLRRNPLTISVGDVN